ncbi:PfkB family carbohydrate kinase, partial [Patulibacter sp. S7RM1-6]
MSAPCTGPTVVVVGPIVRDVSVRFDTLPADGGSADAHEVRVEAGGKGGNPAFVAARLGARVRMVGAVGADVPGDLARAAFARAGIDASGVTVDPDAPTGQIIHLVEPGGRRRYLEQRGANARLAVDAGTVAGLADEDGAVIVSTAIPEAAVRAAVAGGRAAGATVVVDAAGPPAT